ncbi:MAG: hypothetical protein JOZ69_08110 [Myxococcales bacterium]|nr:hypothetical protein [Myxococcales bacterium]
MRGAAAAWVGAGMLWLVPHAARADAIWLPGPARAVPRSTSASRDTPVFEYAYGPTAQGSIGAEPGILAVRGAAVTWRVGLYAMVCLENGSYGDIFPPAELWRGLLGASVAWELPGVARAWLTPGSDLELSLVIGHESDHASSRAALAAPGPLAIPFGGGGNFLAPEIAVRLPAGPALTFTIRLEDRIYFNEVPLLVGAHVASDVVADALHEGVTNAPSADLELRWRATSWAAPQLALYAQHLFPHDPVPGGEFLRVMAGVAFPGRVGEIEPFVSFDGGNGKGLLVEERALRLSVGFRHAFY